MPAGRTAGRNHNQRSTLRYRTPTLNLVQVRARLVEDANDLEDALSMMSTDPPTSVFGDLERIGDAAERIARALEQHRGVLPNDRARRT